jgi:hypothetical protein
VQQQTLEEDTWVQDPDFTSDLDPVTRKKLVAAQINRAHQACMAVDSRVTGAVPEMQQLLIVPLEAVKGVHRAVEMFGSTLRIALLIDAVDAIYMLAAGIAAIAAQCASTSAT